MGHDPHVKNCWCWRLYAMQRIVHIKSKCMLIYSHCQFGLSIKGFYRHTLTQILCIKHAQYLWDKYGTDFTFVEDIHKKRRVWKGLW